MALPSILEFILHKNCNREQRKKKTKTKELKFIERWKRTITFITDQRNRVFWVFVIDKRLDWSEREGRRQLKLKVITMCRVFKNLESGYSK